MSVQNNSSSSSHPIPSIHAPSKSKPKAEKRTLAPIQLPDLKGLQSYFECHLKDRKLHVDVTPTAHVTSTAIDRLVECSDDIACDAVVVSVPKVNSNFADWMRRLLYTGFTVVSKRDSWDLPAAPGAVTCVLDLSDRSSTASDSSSVLTDEGESDADSDASDDESWLLDDDD